MSIHIACPFLDCVVFFFFLNCGYKVSFYILDTNFLLDVSFANFFPSVRVIFSSHMHFNFLKTWC